MRDSTDIEEPSGKKVLLALMGLQIGGAETHVVELACGLAARGYEPVVASAGGVYVGQLEARGIRHVCAPMDSRDPRLLLKAYKILKKLIVEEQIGLVHAHARIPAFLCGRLQKRLGFRFVTTAHGVYKNNLILRLMSDWGDFSLVISDDVCDYLVREFNFPYNRIKLTVNGIDTQRYSPDADCSGLFDELGVPRVSRRIVSLSRLDADAGQQAYCLLELAEELCSAMPDVYIVIVGGGVNFADISARADAVNARLGRRAVVMTGPRTDAPRFFTFADVFVNVGRAAMEALCSARPVILGGMGGYIGLFGPDKLEAAMRTNFTCRGEEPISADKLKADIQRVFAMERGELQRLGEYGRSVISERYSVERMVDDNIAVYRRTLEDETYNEHKFDAAVLGYFGFSNSGDDAILASLTAGIRRYRPGADFCVLTHNMKAYPGADFNLVVRTKYRQVFKVMSHSKVFLSGGGTLVQDTTSTRSLLYYLGMMRIAKLTGCKLMLYASGIGPVRGWLNRRLTGYVLNRADLITTRDAASVTELEHLRVKKPKIELTADAAFMQSPAPPDEIDGILHRAGVLPGEPLVAISLRPWEKYTERLIEAVSSAFERLCGSLGARALLLPMQYDADLPMCERIAARLGARALVLRERCGSDVHLGVISRCELTLGMRLHSIIYSASAAVPCVGIAYETKITGFLEYIGNPSMLPPDGADGAAVERAVTDMWQRRDEVRAQLRERSEQLRALAARNEALAAELMGE